MKNIQIIKLSPKDFCKLREEIDYANSLSEQNQIKYNFLKCCFLKPDPFNTEYKLQVDYNMENIYSK